MNRKRNRKYSREKLNQEFWKEGIELLDKTNPGLTLISVLL
jgi:hypothetical protein